MDEDGSERARRLHRSKIAIGKADARGRVEICAQITIVDNVFGGITNRTSKSNRNVCL